MEVQAEVSLVLASADSEACDIAAGADVGTGAVVAADGSSSSDISTYMLSIFAACISLAVF